MSRMLVTSWVLFASRDYSVISIQDTELKLTVELNRKGARVAIA